MKKRNKTKGYISLLLAAAMIGTTFQMPISVQAEEVQMAVQEADVTVNNRNLALHKNVTVSSLEVADQLTGDMAVDGIYGVSSRWSPSPDDVGATLIVDLGAVYEVTEIDVSFWRSSPEYKVLVSENGTDYETVLHRTDVSGQEYLNQSVDNIVFAAKSVRYVKFQQIQQRPEGGGLWGCTIEEIEVYAGNPNLALDKEVTVSSLEVADQLTGDMAVDGIYGVSSRWSPSPTDENASLIIDLGSVEKVSEIDVSFWRSSPEYKVLVSEDGTDYETVLHRTEVPSEEYLDQSVDYIVFETKNIRYVKFEQVQQRPEGGNLWGCTIEEIEVYRNPVHAAVTAAKILDKIKTTSPTISSDGTKLCLPELEEADYEVQIYGCSNEAVVDLDGRIYQPLHDMEVRIMYQVVNKNDPSDTAVSENEVTFTVPGLYQIEEDDPEKPDVVPEIREWKGLSGEFELKENSRIVVNDDVLKDTAEMVAFYFKEMLKKDISVVSGTPESGDVVLALTEDQELGDEGYAITIADTISVTAYTTKGVLYAGTTLTQMFYQDEDRNTISKGLIRDYPQYETRACHIDVGRIWIPMDYLEEITKYAAYFKISELHVHISDDNGEALYTGAAYGSTFRLESKLYPEINSAEYYTQDEYRAYQKETAKYGIKVITEIDSPGHSGWVNYHNTDYMLDATHLDVTNRDAIAFIKSLYDEFLDGDDPVIQSDTFHIGTDEYFGLSNPEAFASYMNEMGSYIHDKGYKVQFWSNGETGDYPINLDARINVWQINSASSKWFNGDYQLINTNEKYLYAMPGTYTGIPDYLDLENLFENWEVTNFGNGYQMNLSDPKVIGASSAMWYDDKVGTSEFDYFERFKSEIMLMSEKNWYGVKTDDQSASDFLERIDKVDDYAPGANPARFVETTDDEIVRYDFEEVNDSQVPDLTSNEYDATINDLEIEEKAGNHYAVLNSTGYISLPFDSVGFPYQIEFDIKVDSSTPKNAVLFSGDDGILYLNYDNTGKIGYERKGYSYIFDYELPTDMWINIGLKCDTTDMILLVNGKNVAEGKYYQVSARTQDYSTFVLPVEKVGEGVVGCIDNIVIAETIDNGNLAKNKKVTVSSLEVYDGRLTGEMAVDGGFSVTSRWSPGSDDTEAWIMVDLGEVTDINLINLYIYQESAEWKLLISEDSENWTELYHEMDGSGALGDGTIAKTFELEFDTQKARYVKYQQVSGVWSEEHHQYFGSSITEIEVYNKSGLKENTTKLEDLIAEMEAMDLSGYTKDSVESFNQALTDAKDFLKETGHSALDVADVYDELETAKEGLVKKANKALLEQSVLKAETLKKDGLLNDVDSSVADTFNTALTAAKEQIESENATQEVVNEAYKNLNDAIALVRYTVNKNELLALIEVCEEIDLSTYKEEGKDNFITALSEAKELVEKEGQSADSIMKAAIEKLRLAKEALVEKKPIENPFEDVKDGSYYYDAVLWAVENEITSGTSETTFSPKEDCTRAQVVMFLWRAAGCPETTIEENPFSDVSEGSRFYQAILWAYENEITKGYSNGTFRPNDTVRRGEYVTMQYRAAGKPELSKRENPFVDVTEEQYPHYVNAILWAYENGITEGKDGTHFEPNQNCSRANVVTFLYRGTEK